MVRTKRLLISTQKKATESKKPVTASTAARAELKLILDNIQETTADLVNTINEVKANQKKLMEWILENLFSSEKEAEDFINDVFSDEEQDGEDNDDEQEIFEISSDDDE